MQRVSLSIISLLILCSSMSALAQSEGEISRIDFSTIPAGSEVVGETIGLDGAVHVTQGLNAGGEVQSTAGFRFPDGSLQTTAAGEIPVGATANAALYDNRIIEFTPPTAFTEICFKNGSVSSDIHSIPESTVGGSCIPGDIGWVIERDERAAATWEIARAECLMSGMRLPETFELYFTCRDAALFGINDLDETILEWSSNTAMLAFFPNVSGIGVPTGGGVECRSGSWGWVGRGDNNAAASVPYRCLR